MGWLIAFFLTCIAGLLGLFLYLQFDERRLLAAELEAAKTRLNALQPFEADELLDMIHAKIEFLEAQQEVTA